MRCLKKRSLVVALVAFVDMGCGGSEKKVEMPAEPVEEEFAEEEEEVVQIPEEKFEEIKHTFERKAPTVARCFPEAVDAGELDKNDRVKLSIGLVIEPNGTPTNFTILGSSKRSDSLEACVIKSVKRWEFTTLPKALQYSYGFVFQQF